jgi:hypothetical protein
MIASKFLDFVEIPVLFKIPTTSDGTDLQDSFSSVKSPSCPRNIHTVFDQMPTSALNDSGRNGKTFTQELVIVKMLTVFEQVIGTFIDILSCGLG